MKKLAGILICLALFSLTTCKEKKKAETEETQITIEMNKDAVTSDSSQKEESGDCEDFVDDYEAWMDKYIDMLAKYKADPVALATSPEFQSMTSQSMDWASRWSDVAVDCARYPEYEKRFKEIQQKADEELEALGLK